MKRFSVKSNIIMLLIICCISMIGVDLTYSGKMFYSNKSNQYLSINTMNTKEDVVYLSDIPFKKATTAWGNILRDKTSSNTSLSLKVEGNQVTFKKGIWAHATSIIEIDLADYQDYAYFVTYYGVNVTSNNKGNGVKFYVYTSLDGVNWTLKTDSNPGAFMSSSDAGYLKIDIRDIKYLKLYVHDNGHNGNDHAIWADAKLVKEDYNENVVKTVLEYDEEIKNLYKGEMTEDLELLLLQRTFVENVGQFTFKSFLSEEGKEKEHAEVLGWLMSNADVLKRYLMGGKPNGTYKQSLEVLNTLYHNYQKDLTTNEVTSSGNRFSLIYEKMIISLALTHSDNVGFWIHSSAGEEVDINPNLSVASKRYEIFKGMLLNNQLDSMFEDLEVEEMRYIMYSFINDDEIEWLNAYAKSKTNRYSAYSYMNYKNVNTALYRSPIYYGEGRKNYEEKYNLIGYDIKNIAYYPRLWMIMDVGGVCWQLSNVGQNVLTSLGIPSTIVGQPGHTAYIVYGRDHLGRGTWSLWNDVGGWTKTNTAGYTGTKSYYQVRLLNSWGNGSYASSNNGSYVLLAQKALDDYGNYVRAEELVKLASVYSNDNLKLEEIYRKALGIQNINLDAWLGLTNLYINSNKTEEEYYNLALEIAGSLKYYPLPMHDLLRMLNAKVRSTDIKVRFTLLETRTLVEATKATENDVVQSKVVHLMANYLLGIIDTKVADFSFDGENANVLKLSSLYDNSHAAWEYSLDKGVNWVEVTDGHSKTLTSEEISKITEENDILVHIIGTSRDLENIYTIDITKASVKAGLYANDLENRVIGATTSEEWRYSDTNDWTNFETLPDLKGDKTVLVRTKASGTVLSSDTQTFVFTEDKVDPTAVYIPITHLTVSDFSSETDRVGNREYARNVIDGNLYTMWHTNRKVVETNKYIVLKLDTPMYVSALEYVPYQNYSYGVMKDAIVSVSTDGNLWTEVAKLDNRPNNTNPTMIKFDTVTEVQYVKLYIESHDKKFANAAMIRLFHDSTKEKIPTANVELSTYDVTTDDVIATLIYDPSELTITNNDGKNTYTFTENGEFTFEFINQKGIKGKATAIVSNIDRIVPTLDITYGNVHKTNQPVVAILKFSEPVIVLNEDLTLEVHTDANCYTYTFFENESHIIRFKDLAGNENSATISVDWIDTDVPVGEISYSNGNATTGEVIAKLNVNEEVEILNNDGRDTYTFAENGEFTFEFKDLAGNVGSATAVVTWIETKPVVHIVYSTTEKTSDPVIATLEVKGNITIINNDGKNTYTFTENGEFTFLYTDIDHNTYELVAKVDWIEEENKSVVTPGNEQVVSDEKQNSNSSQNNNSGSKISNNGNKSNNKSNGNDTLEDEYRIFETNGITLKILSKLYNKDASLVYKKLTLSEDYYGAIGTLSEYFSLSLQNDHGEILELPDSSYNLTIPLDSSKKLMGIYEVQDGKLIKLDYEKVGASEISVEINNLGEFILSYEAKDGILKINSDKKEYNMLGIIIILGSILLGIVAIILKKVKAKNNK